MTDYFPRQEFQRLGFSEVAIRVLEKVANLADTIDRVGSAEAALGLKQPLDALLTSLSALDVPGADKMLFWDHSAGQLGWLEPAENLAIDGADLDASTGLALDGAKVRKSANLNAQNYTGGGTITWDVEDWDTGGYHSASVNPERLTVTNAGYYQVIGQTRLQNVASNDNTLIQISRFNSAGVLQEVLVRQSAPSFGTIAALNGSGTGSFASGDYATLVVQVISDVSVDFTTTSYFEIRRVG